MIENISEIKQLMKKSKEYLSDKRYEHSLGVMESAVKLAKETGADEQKAAIAGLLHDVAKEIPYEEALQKCEQYGVVVDDDMKRSPKTIHAPLGAAIVQNEFHIVDEEILNAIRFHTVGKSDMTLLEEIIFLADYIEPNRDYEGVEHIREAVAKGLDEGVLTGIENTLSEVISKRKYLHPQVLETWNGMVQKVEKA